MCAISSVAPVFTLVPEYLRGDTSSAEKLQDYGIQLGRRFARSGRDGFFRSFRPGWNGCSHSRTVPAKSFCRLGQDRQRLRLAPRQHGRSLLRFIGADKL